MAGGFSNVKSRLKPWVEKTIGARIIRDSHHGHIDWHDIRRTGLPIRIIVDVGAHVGESAEKFSTAFPDAQIHSLEPVSESYAALCRNVATRSNVTCHQTALGPEDGTTTIYLSGQSTMHSLIPSATAVGQEEVQVQRLDSFAAEQGLDHIDLLKVDAEGLDLVVLRGAEALLRRGRIGFLLTEVGFQTSPDRYHVYFGEVRDFLTSRGMELFGLYDQHLEFTGPKRLRYANACFINESRWNQTG